MKTKNTQLFNEDVLKRLPLQFLYLEEIKNFNNKSRTLKIHKFEHSSELLPVLSFYKSISRLF